MIKKVGFIQEGLSGDTPLKFIELLTLF